MDWNFFVFYEQRSFGSGLAMDAFSVSLANGMNEKKDEEISYLPILQECMHFFSF